MHISVSIVGYLKFVQKAYMSIIMASELHFRHASYCGHVLLFGIVMMQKCIKCHG